MDYFPHLTPSNTGLTNPVNILNSYGWTGDVEVCYVTRTYMTRHGVGRFDTECPKSEINKNMLDMTNVPNPFQDSLRYGKMNWNDLMKNITDDFNKASKGKCMCFPTIAITHINEYGSYPLLEVCKTYHSDGMTRNEVF